MGFRDPENTKCVIISLILCSLKIIYFMCVYAHLYVWYTCHCAQMEPKGGHLGVLLYHYSIDAQLFIWMLI